MNIEHILYKDIDNPKDYRFYITRQCTCHKEWKTIGIGICVKQTDFIKNFKYIQPAPHIPDNQTVILYTEI